MIEQPQRKPLALLIPGLDGTGKFFDGHAAALSARYRVLAWEFRRRSGFGFSELVSELGEASSAEEPGSIVVAGESFGGPVAMHYVLTYPQRVKQLVLINTFAFYRGRIRIRLACRLVPLLSLRVPRAVKRYVVDRTLELEGIPESGRRRYHEIVQLVHGPAYRRRLELVRDVDLRSRLGEIAVPTLIIASGRDKIVPSVAEARYMAAHIPEVRIRILREAGHALLLTPGFSLSEYI